MKTAGKPLLLTPSTSYLAGLILAVVTVLFSGLASHAAHHPLVTDRPDATESPAIVQPGRAQIESGFLFERETDGGEVNTITVPQLLIRTGITEIIEFRFAADGLVYLDREGTNNIANGSDISLQSKVRFTSQNGFLPTTAAIFGVSLPTGGAQVTSDGADPEAIFIWSYDLPKDFSIGGNTGFALPTNGNPDSNRFFQVTNTIALGIPITDWLGAFIEYFGSVATEGEGDPHSIDGGLTFLLTDHVQLDIAGGGGITKAAADFFVGFGASVIF
jgi:hypothetical protein